MFRRTEDPEVRRLRREVGALRRRLWGERALSLATRALALGLGGALLAAVVAWVTVTPVLPSYYAAPALLAIGLAMVASLFRYPSSMEAARLADRRLALRERIATAVELSRGTGLQGPLARRQLATAIDAASWARQHWRGGPRVRGDLGAAGALALLTLGVLLLTGLEERLPTPIPRPSIWSVMPRQGPSAEHAVAEAPPPAGVDGERVTQAPSGRSGVSRALDDVRRGRESGAIGPREAASRLAQAEADLSRQTGESRAQREALDRLGRALDQVAAGRPAAESIQRGDYERAGDEIAALGAESDQLSPQAKAQLAQAVRSAADESGAAADLAGRERRAADALAGRDYEAARRAMGDLGDEVARRGQDVVPQQDLARAWDQVNEERRSQGQGESQMTAQRPDRPGQGQRSAQGPGSAGDTRQGAGDQRADGQGSGNRGAPQGSGSGAGDGAGEGPGGGGHHDDGSLGDEGGSGTSGGSDAAGRPSAAPPRSEAVGQFQPSGQARRLDTQGRPVEVDVRPSQQAGQRPGDPDKDAPSQESDAVGAVSASSGEAPRQITSAAPAESNFVPTDRRQVVREYFSPDGDGAGR